MNKTKKLYRFEDHPEHQAQLAPWRDRWIANAMSTKAMDDEDRTACIAAVNGLYAAAKLPPPKHIVFVPSPFVLAFAGGFSSAIWWASRNGSPTGAATEAATRAATRAATWAATRAATEATTEAATEAATRAATMAATRAATRAATGAATMATTEAATRAATWAATRAATEATTEAATEAATRAATMAATEAATMATTEAATRAATMAATRAATRAATGAATMATTEATTEAATEAATRAATMAATEAATMATTEAATRAATMAATRAATRAATGAATMATTEAATEDDLSKWYVVPADLRRLAQEIGVGDFGLQCAARAWNMWSGGNQWSGYDAYLSFFQDIAKLDIDYGGYTHWRTLAERSGPRIMHADFCMISDRPEVLTVDAQNQPHGEDGPFCRWRDGTALYSWHGARVPARWIEQKATLDPAEVIKAENVEERAAGAAIIGWPKMLKVLKVKVIDDSGSSDIGQLIELELPGLREPGRFLKAACPRNGIIVEGVPRVSDIDGLAIETALHAQAWRIGDPLSDYQHPPQRT